MDKLQNTFRRRWHRAVYEHPLLLIAGLFLATLVMGWLGARYAAEREERSFVAYSEHLMQTFAGQRQKQLGATVRDYAVWDDMVEHIHSETSDHEWLRSNLTGSVYHNLGIEDALVLSPSLRPLYVLRHGEEVRFKRLADWNSEFAALLARRVTLDPELNSLSGVVRTRGVLQFLVAERIRPEHRSAASGRTGGWIIFARDIDPQWRDETSYLLSIKNLSVINESPQGAGPRYRLAGVDDQPVAWLFWQVDREASHDGAAMPLLAGLLVLFVFVTLLARSVLKMHQRENQSQARMLCQSEALRHLARLPHGGEDKSRFLMEITHSVQQVLAAARVSVWRAQGDEFRCVAASDPAAIGEVLDIHAHARYFGYLSESRTLAAADIAGDLRMANVLGSRQARQVVAALDAAIMIRDKLAGMLCIEDARGPREWEPDQIGFAAAVADQIVVAYESDERKRMEAALLRQRHYDALTGLPNAEKLSQLLSQHMLRSGAQVVYSLWHVSGLFHINEEFGQAGGDALLQEFAQRLEQTSGSFFASRLVGNRFVLALLDVAPDQAAHEIEQLYYRLQQPFELAGSEIAVQLSCGVSLAPQDAHSSEELQRHAEFALEAARSGNGSAVEYYASEQNAAARERHQLAAMLPAALGRGELEVHFQPFVDIVSGDIVGAEALVRWRHPGKDWIPPAEFIPLAEETGQIHALGRFVLEESVRCQAEWISRAGREIAMAVNVSALQLRDPEFIPFVEQLLQRYKLPPRMFEIEVTESLSIELFEQAPEAIGRLHALGVCLSIDDFGTGYSSLSYLRRLPARKLKIDRSFIERVSAEQQDADLARMIISLGKILDMTIVAEGVETVEQLQFLREHGCDIGQGFLFSRPVCAADFWPLLERGIQLRN